ncbi:uncharacterized protein EDB93DRAFT_1226238 [Suillus bovinus]|uniref:uncharacterized protein n=1 Tax=Suillus bovinus TaxID=48563 RepID=UPI001B8708DC|nr:uncharacterized protein EDB93DRAFT_1226238 [Suillus bovinus]KAG2148196.1 hypothetical protein EDB93DRAFT_1226238 [Suillus bovinus]
MRTPSTQLINDIPSIYSPANVAVEPVTLRLKASLNVSSIYRGTPSPEIDAAWDRISRNITRMTREEMLKAGTTETELRSKVRYPDEIGGGYMTSIDGLHQAHCVNILRKSTWSEYYHSIGDSTFKSAPATLRMHLDHCIEMLRQSIMCNSDVGIITWYWVEGYSVPSPNFNTLHRCRNFEKIVDWSAEHAIHIDESDVPRFPDTVDLPRPQSLEHLF